MLAVGAYCASLRQTSQNTGSSTKTFPTKIAEDSEKKQREAIVEKMVVYITDRCLSADRNLVDTKLLVSTLIDTYGIEKAAEILDSVILAERMHVKVLSVMHANMTDEQISGFIGASHRVNGLSEYSDQKNLSLALKSMRDVKKK